MKILVTGAAGFIGASLCRRLLTESHEIVGLDNINDYYDPELKYGRLSELGICKSDIEWNSETRSSVFTSFRFVRMNLEDENSVEDLFVKNQFDIVVNLAAQAGVRYSIENPRAYVKSNVVGFLNILEGCRQTKVKHLLYASSSSVYGLNGKVPYSEHDSISHPVSLYAATKKSDELMAHAYSQLYGLPTTGLRFFTVYGPWGRPDMSPFLFIDAILRNKPIKVFNNGDMWRDFTYIDDIVESIARLVDKIPEGNPNWNSEEMDPAESTAPYRIFNVGNQHPTRLMDYILCIEQTIGVEAQKQMLPMQGGDVYRTWADSSALADVTGFAPATPLAAGIAKTVEWFREFYKL